MDYDGSIWKSGILSQENIRYLGAVDYQSLPSEIQFTVAILPFKVNDITISTSPIKIYEYLASGFPVVSAPLPECEAISHVSIGVGYEDFEEKIKSAIVVDSTKTGPKEDLLRLNNPGRQEQPHTWPPPLIRK